MSNSNKIAFQSWTSGILNKYCTRDSKYLFHLLDLFNKTHDLQISNIFTCLKEPNVDLIIFIQISKTFERFTIFIRSLKIIKFSEKIVFDITLCDHLSFEVE